MKKTLFITTAAAVAMSSFAGLASAAPLHSFYNDKQNAKYTGEDCLSKYGVPKEDIVTVPLDIQTKWDYNTAFSDHSNANSPMRPDSSHKNETELGFGARAYLDMSNVAAEWDAYIEAATKYAKEKGLVSADEEGDKAAREYAVKIAKLTGEYTITIKADRTAGETLKGISNAKLEAKDLTGLEWKDVTVDDYTFNTTNFFEYSGEPTYDAATNAFTVKMKVKETADINKALDEYFTKIQSSGAKKQSYRFLLEIPNNMVGTQKVTYNINGTFTGYVDISVPALSTASKVYFGQENDSTADEIKPMEDNEYIRLEYRNTGGGGGGSTGTQTSQKPVVTKDPTATTDPNTTPDPTATSVPSTTAEPSGKPTPIPSDNLHIDGNGKAKLNYDDHYAYIIGYPAEEGQTDDYREVRPQNNITRAEVATIFFRMMTDDSRAEWWTQENSFSDVNINDWFNNAISTAANADIVNGYDTGDFKPNNAITRAEFAAIAARFSSKPYTGENKFNDIAGHWAEESINKAAEAGWITGYDDGSFKPDQKITRAEAMTLINRLLYRLVEPEGLGADMVRWIDNQPGAWYYANVQEATNSHYYDRVAIGYYETWTTIRDPRDWEALEKSYSKVTDAGHEESVFDTSGMDVNTPASGATAAPEATDAPEGTAAPETTDAPEATATPAAK